jgi:16S rRNA (guanine527-N7)-methyltransferase
MLPPDRSGDAGATLAHAAAALGLTLDGRQSEGLLEYLSLLARWNRVYNLSAIRDPAAMLVQHVVDSLAVVAPLRRQLAEQPARLLDVGSGAGLPGLVLAVAMPELVVTCVDAVGKKSAFVREAAGALALSNLQAIQARVEKLGGGGYDIIASRAFASLADFLSLTRHLGGAETRWLAMKGKIPGDEIAALPPEHSVFHVEQLAVPGLAADRCLVWIRPGR